MLRIIRLIAVSVTNDMIHMIMIHVIHSCLDMFMGHVSRISRAAESSGLTVSSTQRSRQLHPAHCFGCLGLGVFQHSDT